MYSNLDIVIAKTDLLTYFEIYRIEQYTTLVVDSSQTDLQKFHVFVYDSGGLVFLSLALFLALQLSHDLARRARHSDLKHTGNSILINMLSARPALW